MEQQKLTTIGNNTFVEIAGIKQLPAKVDTGADSSAIWASNIQINAQDQLEFCLLGPEHPLYSGEVIVTDDFNVKQVRSSNGQVAIRYLVPLTVKIGGRKIRAKFTLANRAKNRFPVLIGRRTLHNKFLVDVTKSEVSRVATFDNQLLSDELRQNPQAFHQKYMLKNKR